MGKLSAQAGISPNKASQPVLPYEYAVVSSSIYEIVLVWHEFTFWVIYFYFLEDPNF